MGKVHILFILISSLMLIANAQSSLFQGREKVAKFRIYAQDALGGPNATVYEVARANITSTSPTTFGQVRVVDDLITAEPDANSKKLGRGQGLITFSDLEESGLTMDVNFVFTAGEYKGSTLCFQGRKLIPNGNQELSIVSGTGVFRWARGYTICNTYSYDPATDYAILIYDIYVVYVEQDSGWGLLAKE